MLFRSGQVGIGEVGPAEVGEDRDRLLHLAGRAGGGHAVEQPGVGEQRPDGGDADSVGSPLVIQGLGQAGHREEAPFEPDGPEGGAALDLVGDDGSGLLRIDGRLGSRPVETTENDA